MTRVKKGLHALKTRKNVLRQVKGYRFGHSKKERQAIEAISHAGQSAFAHRRDKKGDFRKMWNVRINAALKESGAMSYSKFIGALKKNKLAIDRKTLATLAKDAPESFKRIVARVS